MCEPYWGDKVFAWPVGIDTEKWAPRPASEKDIDVLVYDKIRWEHDHFTKILCDPIIQELGRMGLSYKIIRYGSYKDEDFRALLARSRSMIFMCEHETQGIAYQQALSCGVPLLAWDRGGPWKDPSYYPNKVDFGPVSSVPYWDDRCGMRFQDVEGFEDTWARFWSDVLREKFDPRGYIVENLGLELCAQRYLDHARAIEEGPA